MGEGGGGGGRATTWVKWGLRKGKLLSDRIYLFLS